MRTDVNTILGVADRCEYQLGGNMLYIDRLHKLEKSERSWIWIIRESNKNAKRRADETGAVTYPRFHISHLKIQMVYETWGQALNGAIEYITRKRKEGEL